MTKFELNVYLDDENLNDFTFFRTYEETYMYIVYVLYAYIESVFSYVEGSVCFVFIYYRRPLRIFRFFALQVAVVQPILVFIAAVLWSDGKYDGGMVYVLYT
jgi:hypothetical protein